ncbi:MAG TPA: hypothetical protein VGP92_17835, partial [Acidimicrobiia bacterium]|nr:hypothetical protein [Acidimicrobiia bacterium]
MTMGQFPEPVALPLTWVGIDDLPLLYVNQWLVQVAPPGEMMITAGQVSPPPVVGSAEDQYEQLQRWPFVAIRPVARFALSRARLDELI